MSLFLKFFSGLALMAAAAMGAAHAADDFKLSNNQRIACGRGLNAGKLQNINCKSYAFIFNTKTSEFYRCQVSVAVTRDNKEVLKVDTDGNCALRRGCSREIRIILSMRRKPSRRIRTRFSGREAPRFGSATIRHSKPKAVFCSTSASAQMWSAASI